MRKALVIAAGLLLSMGGCSGDDGVPVTSTSGAEVTTSTSGAEVTTSTTTGSTSTTSHPTITERPATIPQTETTQPPTTQPATTAPPSTVPPVDPEAALGAAAAEAAASYDGGGPVGRSCFAFEPGDYECDFSTTAGNNLRIYVTVNPDGTFSWEFAGG